MILLDTSVLIDSLSGSKRSAPALRGAIEKGERILVPALVMYEWLRGPRLPQELAAQEALFPSESAAPFGPQEAALSAKLFRALRRPRGREIPRHCRLRDQPRSGTVDAQPGRFQRHPRLAPVPSRLKVAPQSCARPPAAVECA